MARPKEFDSDAVLDKAAQVFWSKGFEATSVQDLVDAMGINRGSIYATFGDKAALFEAALLRYLSATSVVRLVEMAESGDPRGEITAFFEALVERASRPDCRRGCLITNTLNECCARDNHLAALLAKRMRAMEDAFCTLIERGQQTGDIAPWRDARATARSFMATVQGIQTLVKLNPGYPTFRDIADTALGLLD